MPECHCTYPHTRLIITLFTPLLRVLHYALLERAYESGSQSCIPPDITAEGRRAKSASSMSSTVNKLHSAQDMFGFLRAASPTSRTPLLLMTGPFIGR